MNGFWAFAFRNLWVRKTRTLISASGILLGVAAILAISVMSASTTESLKSFFAQASGRANLTIAEAGTSGEGMPDRTLHRVQLFDGVARAVGTTNRATLLARDKEVSLAIVGIDPESDVQVRTYTLTNGQFLKRRERTQYILVVDKFAANRQIALGDTVTFRLPNGNEEKFTVIGLLADEGAGHLEGGSVGFANLEVAQDLSERGSRLDAIDVIAQPEIRDSQERLAALKDGLQSLLGDKYVVGFPAATGESVSQALAGLNLGLSMFSVIALFVGMLLIHNTFAMSITERTREIGMLRALGTTRAVRRC
jgi:putative ABC transport system permease protein